MQNIEFCIADDFYLFVDDKQECTFLCFGFNVYGIEEEFRMFMFTERVDKVPLKRSTLNESQVKEGFILDDNH
jgi:hypothetical protein